MKTLYNILTTIQWVLFFLIFGVVGKIEYTYYSITEGITFILFYILLVTICKYIKDFIKLYL